MCNYGEGLWMGGLNQGRREGREEGRREGHKEGREEGRFEAEVSSIRQLMQNLHMTVDQAMNALGIPADRQAACLAKINPDRPLS